MTVKKKPTPKKKTVKRKVSKPKAAPKRKVAPKRKASPKKKVAAKKTGRTGRPSPYQKAFGKMAQVACKLGATDDQLAEMFNVSTRTINAWKKKYPDDFLQPIKAGKEEANDEVKQALFHRAKGYSHADVDIRVVNNVLRQTDITKHYPPDTTACVFWLCNRDPENWKRNGEEGGGGNVLADLSEAFMKLAEVLPD